MVWFYLLSGIFLGWSLGSNDAANVFGTAVATKMVKFKTAAIIASIFVIIGAVISGSGAAHTLGKLGAVNALSGSFTVALSAAITVAAMTKMGLPVSTTQAIVGAIVGWDFFSGALIDTNALTKIVSTWVLNPIITAIFSYLLYKGIMFLLRHVKIHLLHLDMYTRILLILIGAFGAYSLGANNIANVMGVFVTSNPFEDLNLFYILHLSGTQILFLIGGLAIALGIFTYSYKVMKTVGKSIFKLSPLSALIVVLSESLVLFIFASESLAKLLISLHLPPIPLVPISSSQAVVGGVIGIGIAKGGGRAINLSMLNKIVMGWIFTPLSSGIITFFALFFMQNVFQQKVYTPVRYAITQPCENKLKTENLWNPHLNVIKDSVFNSARDFKYTLLLKLKINKKLTGRILNYAEIYPLKVDSIRISELQAEWFGRDRILAIKKLNNTVFIHRWELVDTLSKISPLWKYKKGSSLARLYNRALRKRFEKLFITLKVPYDSAYEIIKKDI